MAGRYRTVQTSIWTDARFCGLGALAKFTFLYLLTCPAQTMLGAMRCSMEGLAGELHSDMKMFKDAFQELLDCGMVRYDKDSSFLAVTNFLRHNPPANVNVVKAWASIFECLPECTLRDELETKMDAAKCAMKQPVGRTVTHTVRDTVPQTVTDTVPDTVFDTVFNAQAKGLPIPNAIPLPSSVSSEQRAVNREPGAVSSKATGAVEQPVKKSKVTTQRKKTNGVDSPEEVGDMRSRELAAMKAAGLIA